MNQKSIASIEKLVGANLHDAYVELLLNYPPELARTFPKDRAADEKELFRDSKSIMTMNRLMRRPDHLIDPNDPDSKWPGQYLIIGMDIGTNFYCLKLGSKRTTVYFWFHETNEFTRHAPNLNEFVNTLISKHTRDKG
jgi:hypothetical protein